MNQKTLTSWFKPNFDEILIENSNSSNVKRKKATVKTNNEISIKLPNDANLSNLLIPNSVEDLAVHNKKIEEIQNWFIYNVITSSKVSMLLLTGPTGSGKTATINILCKQLDIEIVEWINMPDINIEEFKGPGQTVKFTEFLIQSSRYPSLFGSTSSGKKITLVEDFPNSLLRNPTEFDGILQKYVNQGKSPIVFICTDVSDRSVNFSHQLFPAASIEKYNITTVSFNPASVTLLKKVLKRAATIIQEKCKHLYQVPSQDAIETIVNSSDGDIRSAINYFNFACLKGSKDLPSTINKSKPTTSKRKRKEKVTGTLTSMCRDESLGLLHGVGRVLYPKRTDCKPYWKFTHKPEDIINQFMSQPTTFLAFLHENYLKYFGDFDSILKVTDYLSLAEIFTISWGEKDQLRQYGMWIAVMGLMVHNENVVSKWNPVRGPNQKSYRKQITSTTVTEAVDKSYLDIILKSNTLV